MSACTYTPGSLIRVRKRDWVVEADSTDQLLHLRPLAGSNDESTWIIPELELPEDAPSNATFPPPSPEQPRSNLTGLRLLHNALRLRMRAGAGPFRSLGNIALTPLPYQLVPLLMALRQPVTRLLIADDVGVGKTIEAGLIVRELMDRGEITRFSVLCPPNLATQWQSELQEHFNIQSEVVTSTSIARLERQIPTGTSVFHHFPVTIVSLDYIKSIRHRDTFLNDAPECIIVDEAHTCTTVSKQTQLRYQLLCDLLDKNEGQNRHMILLTATPHSGNQAGFYNLLGLLDPEFRSLADASDAKRRSLRNKLANFLVQRRRKDIASIWRENRALPIREKALESSYSLAGSPWGEFFEEVREYCLKSAQASQSKRMVWYAMLNLLRCVSSSPAAAVRSLETRLSSQQPSESTESPQAVSDEEENEFSRQFSDQIDSDEPDDQEPIAPDVDTLTGLLEKAKSLQQSDNDPKVKHLVHCLKQLLKDKFTPIVFCQFVSTANYVAEALSKAFPKYDVRAVTGAIPPADRADVVKDLFASEKRILVATNCLSEGINLQNGFDAVVHYDLSWNPTRHEQREGRVDRFGQKSPKVRSVLMYGKDNPVDHFVMKVILRKAETIKNELGVSVPVPTDDTVISEAMVRSILLGNSQKEDELSKQTLLPGFEDYVADMVWKDVSEEQSGHITKFAQQGLNPDDIMKEYNIYQYVLGSHDDLRFFLTEACTRLGAPLEEHGSGDNPTYRLPMTSLPSALTERLEEVGIRPNVKDYFAFSLRPAGGTLPAVTRSHPLVSTISDFLAEQTLDAAVAPHAHQDYNASTSVLGRWAVVRTDVSKKRTLFLVRIRHQLTSSFAKRKKVSMVEELAILAQDGAGSLRWLSPEEQSDIASTSHESLSNINDSAAQNALSQALTTWQQAPITEFLDERVAALIDDHRRLREAAHIESGDLTVTYCLPADLVGVAILLPSIPFA